MHRTPAKHEARRNPSRLIRSCHHNFTRQRISRVAVVATVFAIALASCTRKQETTSVPPVVGPPPDDASSRPDAKPVDSRDWKCPSNTAGSPMVLIPVDEGRPFCIDQRLASYGDYMQFVAAKGDDFSGQPPECSWNQGWGPEEYGPHWGGWYLNGRVYCGPPPAEVSPDQMLGCVDFCDAFAFCSWSGKRLCGLRGADPDKVNMFETGGETEEAENKRREIGLSPNSEWFSVCTQGGKTEFPYGDKYVPGLCWDFSQTYREEGGPFLAHSVNGQDCSGTIPPYDHVYEMIGAAHQWVNICFDSLWCVAYGGSTSDSCERSDAIMEPQSLGVVGVRCCADAVDALGEGL